MASAGSGQETAGQRLRSLRLWRRMTLAEVAGLAGLSAGYLSMVERGLRPLDRRSTICALAGALRVSETDLTGGPHLTADPSQSAPHTTIPALRIALSTNTLTNPACDQARSLPQLLAALSQVIEPLFFACDYVQLGQELPPVIDELHYHAAAGRESADRRPALLGLIDACAYAAIRAKDLGYRDLAHLAATRATEAAELLGDSIAEGKASYIWLQTVPRSWDRSLRAADRAAAAIAAAASTDRLAAQVLGQICLSAALAAAVLHKPDDAAERLAEAARLATGMPDEPHNNWHCFSQTNIVLWKVALALERGESAGHIQHLATQVDQPKLASRRSRLCSFRTDVGRGLAQDRRMHAEAVHWLRSGERAAPQRFRNNAAARDTVSFLLTRARREATSRELRAMASRMGIQH